MIDIGKIETKRLLKSSLADELNIECDTNLAINLILKFNTIFDSRDEDLVRFYRIYMEHRDG